MKLRLNPVMQIIWLLCHLNSLYQPVVAKLCALLQWNQSKKKKIIALNLKRFPVLMTLPQIKKISLCS
ncbi:fimbrial protein [Shigella sonnei]|nr:fimbrial protein [Shigella sonnei]